MSTSQSDMANRIANYFNNPTYFTPADLNSSIQDGYDEIGAFSGLFLKGAQVPFVANLSYYDLLTMLGDYIGVVAIFNTGIKRWMTPASVLRFDRDRIDWETALGVPYFFSVISHRYMAIYKKPAVAGYGSMYIFYRAASPTLGPNDLFAIPDEYIETAQDYVLSDLWAQNQEWVKAQNKMTEYIDHLNQLKVWIKSQRDPDRVPMLLP